MAFLTVFFDTGGLPSIDLANVSDHLCGSYIRPASSDPTPTSRFAMSTTTQFSRALLFQTVASWQATSSFVNLRARSSLFPSVALLERSDLPRPTKQAHLATLSGTSSSEVPATPAPSVVLSLMGVSRTLCYFHCILTVHTASISMWKAAVRNTTTLSSLASVLWPRARASSTMSPRHHSARTPTLTSPRTSSLYQMGAHTDVPISVLNAVGFDAVYVQFCTSIIFRQVNSND